MPLQLCLELLLLKNWQPNNYARNKHDRFDTFFLFFNFFFIVSICNVVMGCRHKRGSASGLCFNGKLKRDSNWTGSCGFLAAVFDDSECSRSCS